MARDKQQQLEAASRIRDLRGAKPQPVIAEALRVKLRTYQHWEAGDGMIWENLQKLAAYHDVSEDWILYGRGEGPATTPAPTGTLDQRLAGLQQSTEMILAELQRLSLEADVARERKPRAGAPKGTKRRGRKARAA